LYGRIYRSDVLREANGIGSEGSAPADRAGDEPAGSDAASSEDAVGGLEARRWHFMQRRPSPKATKKLRERVRELTGKRQQSGQQVEQIIAKTGTRTSRLGELFPDGECRREFNKVDYFVDRSLLPLALPAGRAAANEAGSIHRRSAIRDGFAQVDGHREIPGANHTQKISLSRVPENGTHGLKGDIRNRLM